MNAFQTITGRLLLIGILIALFANIQKIFDGKDKKYEKNNYIQLIIYNKEMT